ncbi:TonB-dependent hemoglobin/transferrin/lactoferrin family receptor [Nitrincola sp. MINF-07-Sa-05]|uniref:TonB-dependent hemoglobin/transferrin/lactoferrin family receptor n=1 Tax=Nitrincola salilacus TaxID=3400273 RepID=UPI00391804DB
MAFIEPDSMSFRELGGSVFPLSLLATALMSATAIAADATDEGYRIAPITVTATRSGQTTEEVSASVSVIEAEQIERQQINDLRDLLRYEPGVNTGGGGSRFGLDGITIRGIGGNRVLTQVDGLPIAEAFSFGPFLDARRNYVDTDALKQVEVIRGPASSLHGANALGGVVAFVTKDAADYLDQGDGVAGRLKAGYDSKDKGATLSGTIAGRQDNLDGLLHLSQRRYNETRSYGRHRADGAARTHADPVDATTQSALAKLGWEPDENQRLQLTLERFRDDLDTEVRHLYNTTTGRPPALVHRQSYDADDRQQRDKVSLDYWVQSDNAAFDEIRTRLAWQESQSDQHTIERRLTNGQMEHQIRDSNYREEVVDLGVQLDKSWQSGQVDHHMTYGMDLRRLESHNLRRGVNRNLTTGQETALLPTSDFPDPVADTLGLYIQNEMTIGNLTLLPGLRYDRHRIKPSVSDAYLNSGATDMNPPDYSASRVTPRLGVRYQLQPGVLLFAQYAEGFRAPPVTDMYGEFVNAGHGYQTLANPNLKEETSRGFEIGTRLDNRYGRIELTAFHNQYKGFIEQQRVPTPGGGALMSFQSINLDRVVIKGAEVSGRAYLDEIGVGPLGSHAGFSLAYAHGQDRGGNKPLNSIEPLTAIFNLGYEDPSQRWGTDLYWTLVGAKKRIDQTEAQDARLNSFPAPAGYGLVDLSGWYRFGAGVELSAGLYNLTDKRYWRWNDVRGVSATDPGLERYSASGRTLAVNLNWYF